ncbi:oxalate/formate MFS antiporter [Acidocella sp.]|uniref:oxalate/formate MFS antiporter n=1 Tax=Acidocella sp. TaxID=50710 RepID=UPI002F41E4B3
MTKTNTMPAQRWVQLGLGLICMAAISSPQYVWALFTKPMTSAFHVGLPAIQVTFSLLVLLQTFLSPFQGWLIGKFGPRLLLSTGALFTGLSWVLASHVTTVMGLYLTYGLLGGIGTGMIYVGVVGHMVQWFPDRRGFATGMVAAGYGFGAVLTTFPISAAIKAAGYQHALLEWGIILGAVGIAAALGLKRPDPAWETAAPRAASVAHPAVKEGTASFTSGQMLRTPLFWLMFAMMTMMAASGLMVISQFGAFSRDWGLGDALVFGLPALPLALSIDRITNGLTRPFFGWVSDQIGRENTMLIAFGIEGLAIAIWLLTRNDATVFVLMSGVVFFGWGEIFSLFPSTLTDTFGPKHATANYGFLYLAFGVAGVLGGPLAALLHKATGSWMPVFELVIAMNFVTALLALFVLKPMRRRWLTSSGTPAPAAVIVGREALDSI